MKLVEHHLAYKELDGVDITISVTEDEHKRIHIKRPYGIGMSEIVDAAAKRTYQKKNVMLISFRETVAPNILLFEMLKINKKTEHINVVSGFQGNHGLKLYQGEV